MSAETSYHARSSRHTRQLFFCTRDLLAPKNSVAQNLRAQSAAPMQKLQGALTKRHVHPFARRAFRRSQKTNALNFKFVSDQSVQIHDISNHVVPENRP